MDHNWTYRMAHTHHTLERIKQLVAFHAHGSRWGAKTHQMKYSNRATCFFLSLRCIERTVWTKHFQCGPLVLYCAIQLHCTTFKHPKCVFCCWTAYIDECWNGKRAESYGTRMRHCNHHPASDQGSISPSKYPGFFHGFSLRFSTLFCSRPPFALWLLVLSVRSTTHSTGLIAFLWV